MPEDKAGTQMAPDPSKGGEQAGTKGVPDQKGTQGPGHTPAERTASSTAPKRTTTTGNTPFDPDRAHEEARAEERRRLEQDRENQLTDARRRQETRESHEGVEYADDDIRIGAVDAEGEMSAETLLRIQQESGLLKEIHVHPDAASEVNHMLADARLGAAVKPHADWNEDEFVVLTFGGKFKGGSSSKKEK